MKNKKRFAVPEKGNATRFFVGQCGPEKAKCMYLFSVNEMRFYRLLKPKGRGSVFLCNSRTDRFLNKCTTAGYNASGRKNDFYADKFRGRMQRMEIRTGCL